MLTCGLNANQDSYGFCLWCIHRFPGQLLLPSGVAGSKCRPLPATRVFKMCPRPSSPSCRPPPPFSSLCASPFVSRPLAGRDPYLYLSRFIGSYTASPDEDERGDWVEIECDMDLAQAVNNTVDNSNNTEGKGDDRD